MPNIAERRRAERHDSQQCTHEWQDENIVFSCGTVQEVKVCVKCEGLVQPCEGCKQHHLVEKGQGGVASMPTMTTRDWLEKHRCNAESIGDIPIPFVRMPPDYDSELETHATYWEYDEEPGVFELAELSG